MSEGDKALKILLDRLHAAEVDLELANALTPEDHRLNDAEIILHKAISEIDRAIRGLPRQYEYIHRADSYGAPR